VDTFWVLNGYFATSKPVWIVCWSPDTAFMRCVYRLFQRPLYTSGGGGGVRADSGGCDAFGWSARPQSKARQRVNDR